MSYETTWQKADVLNRELRYLRNRGDVLKYDMTRRPDLQVVSFEPIALSQYKDPENPAPLVVGKLALRKYILLPHPTYDEALIFAAMQGYGPEGYAFRQDVPEEINEIAVILGHPEVVFTFD
jgi:hypothetical protein